MKQSIIIAILLTIGVFGCKDNGVVPDDTRSPSFWSFNYSAYDILGNISATGTLDLSIDNPHVTGSWKFDDGRTGNLAGSIDNNIIQIDLYPGFADHNLILTGRFSNNTFFGEWIMYGWAILGRGSFIATVNAGKVLD